MMPASGSLSACAAIAGDGALPFNWALALPAKAVPGNRAFTSWKVSVATDPAWVNSKCTACGDCTEACTTEVPDPYNLGMCTVKAIRLPHLNAWPKRFVFDRDAVGAAATDVDDSFWRKTRQ